jgi:hypothetical protein
MNYQGSGAMSRGLLGPSPGALRRKVRRLIEEAATTTHPDTKCKLAFEALELAQRAELLEIAKADPARRQHFSS